VARRRSSRLPAAGLLIVAVIALDQLTKWLVRRDAAQLPRRLVSWVTIEIVHNKGISFGTFAQGGLWVLIVVSIVVVILVVLLFRLGPRYSLPLALIIAGSLGNVIDRLRFGYVLDFVTVPHWPTFNVSDLAIASGAVWLGLVVLTSG
jgi:signal peptidase II